MTGAKPSYPGWKRRWAGLITPAILVMASVALYRHTLHYPFQFDGIYGIQSNPHIKDITNIQGIWEYNPSRFLVFLSWAVNYYIGALDTLGYNLVNILIHAADVLLVYYFIGLLFTSIRKRGGAMDNGSGTWMYQFTAALLFAVHPIQTEAVVYIWQRSSSMGAMFYLLSMAAYLKSSMEDSAQSPRPGWSRWMSLSWAAALAGMFTKQFCFTLPFALALMEFAVISGSMARFRERIILLRPFIPLLLITPFLTIYYESGEARDIAVRAADVPAPHKYLQAQFNVVTMYLRLMIYPAGQNLDYDIPIPTSFLEWAPSLGFLLAIVAGAGLLYPKNPIASFGILFFFLAMSVESSFFPLPDIAFEHRMYLPSAGLFIALAAAMEGVERAFGRRWGIALAVIAALAAGPLSAATFLRTQVWATPATLWEDTARQSPQKGRVLINLAAVYKRTGRYAEAEILFEKIIGIRDTIPEMHHDLGTLKKIRGDLEGAEKSLRRAIQLKPELVISVLELGKVHEAQGRLEDAVADYTQAIQVQPTFLEARYKLATLYTKMGKSDDAEKVYADILTINPGDRTAIERLDALRKAKGRATGTGGGDGAR